MKITAKTLAPILLTATITSCANADPIEDPVVFGKLAAAVVIAILIIRAIYKSKKK